MGKSIRRSVRVTGFGRVAAPPDVLALTLAIETQAPTVSQSLGENNRVTTAVISALSARGVQERDLQTVGLTIDPVFEQPGPDDLSLPRIVAFRTRNSLRARLRDLAGAGAVIDAAVQAGGDASRLEGVSFSFDDPAALLVEARRRAIDDANARARQLAEGLGVRLGEVISIDESVTGGPQPDSGVIRLAAAVTPIAPGEEEVVAQVTVEYKITGKT